MIIKDWLKPVIVPIHKEGYLFIAGFALITFMLFLLDVEFLGFFGLILTVWCALFFRDPIRTTPTDSNLVVSPADGVVQSIVEDFPPEELGYGKEKLTKISVFMNVFNVHINRSPISGVVMKSIYKSGKFFNADLDKASKLNERQSYVVKTKLGKEIVFVQIAGLVARRIKSFVVEGDELKTGERFGLIRFGSRVDVYLPKGVSPLVCVNQTMIAGETVLADFNNSVKRDHLSS